MSKREPKPLGPGTSVLRRLLDNWKGKMSPALAKHVLTLGFSEADQERMADLAERNQDGLNSVRHVFCATRAAWRCPWMTRRRSASGTCAG